CRQHYCAFYKFQQRNRAQRLQPCAMLIAPRDQMINAGSHQERPSRKLARSSWTISCAARLAASCCVTSKEIAPTRACPPPPYRSHTFARFTTGGDGAQGFDPTDTFTRKLLLLRPTL